MPDRAIDAVMFDLGGVLVRIRREWTAQCASIGIVPTPRSLELVARTARSTALDAWQRGDRSLESCAELWASTLEPGTPSSIGRALLESIVEAPYEGTVELIEELNGLGIVTGCLSNTNGLHWERMMREFAALRRFHHRLASHELLLAKPEPAMYAHAASVLGVPADRILLFDDLAENCEGARAAGWLACQIDHEGNTANQMRAHLMQLGIPLRSES
ncbi:MAG: HAD-IA family hydrolase [Phycisphaerae bacterium]|nr:HAD-IA family hydrolase [Phycisphaerae bacterium]